MATCKHGHERPEGSRYCPTCKNNYRRGWRKRNPEKNAAYDRGYVERNREKYLARKKRYYENNPEQVKKWYPETQKRKPLYNVYNGMLQRCYNPKCIKFKFYGGRGVTVCDRWLGEGGYKNFEEDMSPRPSKKHTLDRKDTRGNYEKSNCRWATKEVQMRNRLDTCYVTINGITKCATEWCEEYGIKTSTFGGRLERGWTGEKLLQAADQRFNKLRRKLLEG